jgi:hypothetical protein
MQVCLITALIVKRYKRKNYSFVIILLNIRLIEKTKPRDINACCEQSIENPQRAWTCLPFDRVDLLVRIFTIHIIQFP